MSWSRISFYRDNIILCMTYTYAYDYNSDSDDYMVELLLSAHDLVLIRIFNWLLLRSKFLRRKPTELRVSCPCPLSSILH